MHRAVVRAVGLCKAASTHDSFFRRLSCRLTGTRCLVRPSAEQPALFCGARRCGVFVAIVRRSPLGKSQTKIARDQLAAGPAPALRFFRSESVRTHTCPYGTSSASAYRYRGASIAPLCSNPIARTTRGYLTSSYTLFIPVPDPANFPPLQISAPDAGLVLSSHARGAGGIFTPARRGRLLLDALDATVHPGRLPCSSDVTQ